MSSDTFNLLLSLVTPLTVLAALVWLALVIFAAQRRRALNLTTSETVKNGAVKPGFLSVNEEKREAALKGGEAFDAHMAAREADGVVPTAQKACGIAKLAAIVMALATVATGVIGALMRVSVYDETVRRLRVWDNLVDTVQTYPVGFTVAVVVILISAFNALRLARTAF